MQLIQRLSVIDQQLFLRLASMCHKQSITSIAKAISRTGDGHLQLLLPLVMLVTDDQAGTVFFKLALLAFIVERSIYWILKNSLKRPRPPVAIPSYRAAITASDEFSFPSGHTSAAFLLATLFLTYSTPIGVLLYLWACAVGSSRVALGVHFPADILAGATLGISLGLLIS